MSFPEDCPCRHESVDHCPCVTVEEIELSDEEFEKICSYLTKNEVKH